MGKQIVLIPPVAERKSGLIEFDSVGYRNYVTKRKWQKKAVKRKMQNETSDAAEP